MKELQKYPNFYNINKKVIVFAWFAYLRTNQDSYYNYIFNELVKKIFENYSSYNMPSTAFVDTINHDYTKS